MSERPSLDELSGQIERLRKQEAKKTDAKAPHSSSYAMRVGMDLVSGVAVGTAFGYGVDQLAGTLPFGMLIGMLLGLGAGVKLMMETAARAARAAEQEEDNNG
ncbi:MAG: hypothetical protein CMM93_02950 [Rickettsiales bacterium]|nr:hypothetical protein [Rickettsiales bacterium]